MMEQSRATPVSSSSSAESTEKEIIPTVPEKTNYLIKGVHSAVMLVRSSYNLTGTRKRRLKPFNQKKFDERKNSSKQVRLKQEIRTLAREEQARRAIEAAADLDSRQMGRQSPRPSPRQSQQQQRQQQDEDMDVDEVNLTPKTRKARKKKKEKEEKERRATLRAWVKNDRQNFKNIMLEKNELYGIPYKSFVQGGETMRIKEIKKFYDNNLTQRSEVMSLIQTRIKSKIQEKITAANSTGLPIAEDVKEAERTLLDLETRVETFNKSNVKSVYKMQDKEYAALKVIYSKVEEEEAVVNECFETNTLADCRNRFLEALTSHQKNVFLHLIQSNFLDFQQINRLFRGNGRYGRSLGLDPLACFKRNVENDPLFTALEHWRPDQMSFDPILFEYIYLALYYEPLFVHHKTFTSTFKDQKLINDNVGDLRPSKKVMMNALKYGMKYMDLMNKNAEILRCIKTRRLLREEKIKYPNVIGEDSKEHNFFLPLSLLHAECVERERAVYKMAMLVIRGNQFMCNFYILKILEILDVFYTHSDNQSCKINKKERDLKASWPIKFHGHTYVNEGSYFEDESSESMEIIRAEGEEIVITDARKIRHFLDEVLMASFAITMATMWSTKQGIDRYNSLKDENLMKLEPAYQPHFPDWILPMLRKKKNERFTDPKYTKDIYLAPAPVRSKILRNLNATISLRRPFVWQYVMWMFQKMKIDEASHVNFEDLNIKVEIPEIGHAFWRTFEKINRKEPHPNDYLDDPADNVNYDSEDSTVNNNYGKIPANTTKELVAYKRLHKLRNQKQGKVKYDAHISYNEANEMDVEGQKKIKDWLRDNRRKGGNLSVLWDGENDNNEASNDEEPDANSNSKNGPNNSGAGSGGGGTGGPSSNLPTPSQRNDPSGPERSGRRRPSASVGGSHHSTSSPYSGRPRKRFSGTSIRINTNQEGLSLVSYSPSLSSLSQSDREILSGPYYEDSLGKSVHDFEDEDRIIISSSTQRGKNEKKLVISISDDDDDIDNVYSDDFKQDDGDGDSNDDSLGDESVFTSLSQQVRKQILEYSLKYDADHEQEQHQQEKEAQKIKQEQQQQSREEAHNDSSVIVISAHDAHHTSASSVSAHPIPIATSSLIVETSGFSQDLFPSPTKSIGVTSPTSTCSSPLGKLPGPEKFWSSGERIKAMAYSSPEITFEVHEKKTLSRLAIVMQFVDGCKGKKSKLEDLKVYIKREIKAIKDMIQLRMNTVKANNEKSKDGKTTKNNLKQVNRTCRFLPQYIENFTRYNDKLEEICQHVEVLIESVSKKPSKRVQEDQVRHRQRLASIGSASSSLSIISSSTTAASNNNNNNNNNNTLNRGSRNNLNDANANSNNSNIISGTSRQNSDSLNRNFVRQQQQQQQQKDGDRLRKDFSSDGNESGKGKDGKSKGFVRHFIDFISPNFNKNNSSRDTTKSTSTLTLSSAAAAAVSSGENTNATSGQGFNFTATSPHGQVIGGSNLPSNSFTSCPTLNINKGGNDNCLSRIPAPVGSTMTLGRTINKRRGDNDRASFTSSSLTVHDDGGSIGNLNFTRQQDEKLRQLQQEKQQLLQQYRLKRQQLQQEEAQQQQQQQQQQRGRSVTPRVHFAPALSTTIITGTGNHNNGLKRSMTTANVNERGSHGSYGNGGTHGSNNTLRNGTLSSSATSLNTHALQPGGGGIVGGSSTANFIARKSRPGLHGSSGSNGRLDDQCMRQNWQGEYHRNINPISGQAPGSGMSRSNNNLTAITNSRSMSQLPTSGNVSQSSSNAGFTAPWSQFSQGQISRGSGQSSVTTSTTTNSATSNTSTTSSWSQFSGQLNNITENNRARRWSNNLQQDNSIEEYEDTQD